MEKSWIYTALFRAMQAASGGKKADFEEIYDVDTSDVNRPNPELVERVRLQEERDGMPIPPRADNAPNMTLDT